MSDEKPYGYAESQNLGQSHANRFESPANTHGWNDSDRQTYLAEFRRQQELNNQKK